jgi:competence protein ComEA
MKSFSQIALIAATLAAVAGGIFLLIREPSSGDIEIALPAATPVAEVEIRVYVSGAVRNPGVYAASEGDRLAQVIETAGGATEDADMSAVNLAARVNDEDHWHVPRTGETHEADSVQAGPTSGKVQINTADAKPLEGLPGIGPVKAESIIRHRETNGPFASVQDLLAVSGIGAATLDAIRDLIEVR